MDATQQQQQQPKKSNVLKYILFGLLGLIVVIGMATASIFSSALNVNNQFKTADVQREGLAAEINNQYKRRADLIPQLVEVVKGEASFEKETLNAVISARARANSIQLTPEALNNPDAMKQFSQRQGDLTTALSKLMSLTENYPELKANQAFRDLHSQIEGAENRIAVARNRYINQVTKQNSIIATFPASFYAGFFQLHPVPQLAFEDAEENKKAPKFEFNFK